MNETYLPTQPKSLNKGVTATLLPIERTELVWPGKYNSDGTRCEVPRVNLPFQVIETINESRATREGKRGVLPGLFDVWEGKEGDTFEAGWKNKLIWGDNLLVIGSLLDKFAGKIDLIYIDPPFATGADFTFTSYIGEKNVELAKQQSSVEEKAYRDTWGRGLDSYLEMMVRRLLLMKDLLSDTGSIYVHIGPNISHYVKPALDEVFGQSNFLNEIVWQRFNFHADAKRFGIVHDYLLFYAKSADYYFEKQYTDLKESYQTSHFTQTDEQGRRYRLDNATAPAHGKTGKPMKFGKHTLHPPTGAMWRWSQENIDNLMAEGKIVLTSTGMPAVKRYLDEAQAAVHTIWQDIKPLNSQSNERLDYDTQKPETLLERVIEASSKEGGLVADFFCGSGTTMAAAEKLKRRWIGCDLSRWAVHTTRKRLLGIENCKAFDVLNLGKYERKYWQGVTFSDPKRKRGQEIAIFQYIVFILKLYSAQPLTGMQHLHGKKGKAMVHVGAVDAPVTIDEVNACIDEGLAVKQTELHILGWEWEMGLANLMVEEAKRRSVKLLLLNIPREVMEEQAVDQGDIRFFEVAHIEVKIATEKGRKLTVTLKDFAFPYAELVPEEVRSKIKKWSDYIDYWAVDWNFQNDTFMNGWVAYRTRKERKLPLEADHHSYDKSGTYTVMVKVVDIFGNDTSQAFEVEVK
jgi:DNA modification methylase